MADYQEASNDYDMLKGCVNRMFVTHDKKEVEEMYESAICFLGRIKRYGMERLREKEDKN